MGSLPVDGGASAGGEVAAPGRSELLCSAAEDPALVSDMGKIPFRTAHEARPSTGSGLATAAARGSRREPEHSIH